MSEKTILYVEDNEMNRQLVRDLLKRTTYKLIEAHDGEAGVAKALEARPDLILMDIQLPKISGLEAMRRIRAEHDRRPPIIAITSFALPATTIRRRNRAPPPVAKPYSPRDLLALIRRFFRAETLAMAQTSWRARQSRTQTLAWKPTPFN